MCHLFCWKICDLMSSHALKLKHQYKDPCTQASELILSQMLRICFANFPYLPYIFCTVDQKLQPWTNCCLINKRVARDMNKLLPWNMTSQKFKVRAVAWATGHSSKASFCWRSTQEICLPKFNHWSSSSNSTSRFGEPKNESHSLPWQSHISEPVLVYLMGTHLLCCGKQTDILVINPKRIEMLSLANWRKNYEWCNFEVRLLQKGFSIKRKLPEDRCWKLSAFMSFARWHLLCLDHL